MVPIYNKFIPFKGFYAITILKWVFIRKEYESLHNTYEYDRMMNHESIHYEQEKELGFIFFYLLYLLEWLFKLPIYGMEAYDNISFEKEAFANENNFEYLTKRKHYNWLKLIFRDHKKYASQGDIEKLFKE